LHISSAGVATYFEANGIQDIAIFPAMAFIFSAVSMLFLPLQNTYLRKLEKDADIFALQLTNLKGAFITLMEKFSSKNLSDKDPNRIIEFLVYDHPSISRRIELARRFGEGK
jgi:STE24 endopeptidase